MPTHSRSAKYYLERTGRRHTFRGPVPHLVAQALEITRRPTKPPLPLPQTVPLAKGAPPDAAKTTVWPHGLESDTPIE